MIRDKLELLLGQRLVLNLEMNLASVQESVTVTSDAPLIDVSQSRLAGNIDTRQMQALPVNGRSWMQLTMLAPGSRQNAVTESVFGNISGSVQLNMDGQQASQTQTAAGLGQQRFSRDAIGEFELVSSRFDATLGRSRGVQVNAVTKAGTNTYAGTLSGYFRDDHFNAKDFIVNRVLTYSNQQVSATFGGPLKKDKIHFFGYYEGEREPQSKTFTSPFRGFNIADMTFTQTQHLAGVRIDNQLSPASRLMVRSNGWLLDLPILGTAGATAHPSSFQKKQSLSGQIFASLTQTIGQRATNEVKLGLSLFHDDRQALVAGAPQILLRSYTIGPAYDLIEHQDTYSLRDDFSVFRGGHELKLGGEFLLPRNYIYWPGVNAHGVIDATLGPVPANIEDLFPVWNDISTWNVAPLSPITRQYMRSFGT